MMENDERLSIHSLKSLEDDYPERTVNAWRLQACPEIYISEERTARKKYECSKAWEPTTWVQPRKQARAS